MKQRATIVGLLILIGYAHVGCSQLGNSPVALPEFHVEGWVDQPAPTRDQLVGRVVVLDFWAHW